MLAFLKSIKKKKLLGVEFYLLALTDFFFLIFFITFFFQIPAKLVYLLGMCLSCSSIIPFFVVTQGLLLKMYYILFPHLQEELLNY